MSEPAIEEEDEEEETLAHRKRRLLTELQRGKDRFLKVSSLHYL